MFSAIRRTFLRQSYLFQLNQSCISNKFESKFINQRRFIIVKSSQFINGGLYNIIRRSLASQNYPEHFVVKLPALSPTMESGGISAWNKKEGDSVSEGDVIAEVETDKATIGVEASDQGFVAKILIPAGTVGIKVGTPICIIVEKKEDIVAFKDYEASNKEASETPSPASVPTPPSPPKPPEGPSIKSGPPSRKPAISFKKGESQESITPKPAAVTPPGLKPTTGEAYTDNPVTNIRAIIAKRLVQSKKDIPHFYLNVEVEMTQIDAIRKVLNTELAKSGVKISVNDIIVKASALACREVPESNSAWMEKFIRHYNTVDVSVAVSTPTGLMTPIVFNADVKALREISGEIKELAKRARQGKLKPHEFQGGTFTVSNLGMFGVSQFFAIINPPHSCILSVGTEAEKLFMKDSKISTIGVKKYINVSLSCDHRVVDGAVGAQWLKAFKRFIEDPKTMF